MPPIPRYQKVNASIRLRDLSPVAYFRVLLGMTLAQREQALAERQPADREAILRKIAEYSALAPEIREARLHQTDLRWALVDLMKLPPAQRQDRLRALAPADRQLIDARLADWDKLPAKEQQAYLARQEFIGFYLRWQAASAPAQIQILSQLPPDKQTRWLAELPRWQALPEQTRQQICDQFTRFVEMDPQRQKAAVSGLSEGERREMEVSLRHFAMLPPGDRRQCVAAFGKFATMEPGERNQFLRNAAQWEQMSPRERALWRRLVRNLPQLPPLPPGFDSIPAGGLPPMPPNFGRPPMPPAPKSAYADLKTKVD